MDGSVGLGTNEQRSDGHDGFSSGHPPIQEETLEMLKCSPQLLAGFLFLSRMTLGIVFLWTGLSKLQSPYDFLSSIYMYELVNPYIGVLLARSLPWLETVLGLSLILGVFRRGSLLLATSLLFVFLAAQTSAFLRDLKIPCGCVTNETRIISRSDVIREGTLFVISFLAYISVVRMRALPTTCPKMTSNSCLASEKVMA